MKKVLVFIVVALSLAFASPALAAQGYMGAAYSLANADFGSGVDFDLGVLTVVGGGKFNDNFSLEGRIGFGVQDDDIGGVASLELDHYLGIYGRGSLALNNFSPYIVLGFTQAEVTIELLGLPASEDDSGFSYGIGTDVMVGERAAVNVEYIYLMEFEDAVDVDAFSFGMKYFF